MLTRRLVAGIFAAAFFVLPSLPAAATCTYHEQARFTAPDVELDDRFGYEVALSGDTAVIGVNRDFEDESGSAYVFRNNSGVWQQVAKLTAADAVPGLHFGKAVAIDGNTIFIGTGPSRPPPGHYGGTDIGSVYVFHEIEGVWQQIAKLTASDTATNNQFGISVAIDGTTAIIGAHYAAYVFRKVDGTWQEAAKLVGNPADSDGFGVSVALRGDKTIIGASLSETARGSAYVFREVGGVWIETARLTAADAALYDQFGYSVDFSGSTAVIGAYQDDDGGVASGSAYVFQEADGVWQQVAKLTASDATSTDYFGCGVAINGDTAVVGAYGANGTVSGSGIVYLFRNVGGVWRQSAKLEASDAATADRFGTSLSLDGTTLLVGASYTANGGAAYVSDLTPGLIDCNSNAVPDDCEITAGTSQDCNANTTPDDCEVAQAIPDHLPKLLSPDPAPFDQFGLSVSLSGATALIGAKQDDEGGVDAGAAHVFSKTGGAWQQIAKLDAGDTAPDDQFGNSVSLSGAIAVIGAYLDDDAGIDSGAAYVFRQDSGDWQQVAKLTADDAAANDCFGISVSVSGGTALIGAWQDDDDGWASGSSYVFRQVGDTWQQIAKLTAADASASDYFGVSVSLSGSTALIGSHGDDGQGSAYLFRETGGNWQQIAKLSAPDVGLGDQFGISVSLSGNTAVIGAAGADDGGTDAGCAYVFHEVAGTWEYAGKLVAADVEPEDRFGVSVSVSQDWAVIGAAGDDDAGAASGSAYLFYRLGGIWRQIAKVTSDDAAAGDLFGWSVSMSGTAALVGAYGHGGHGSAYVLDLNLSTNDCNANARPDECDLAAGTSEDCNTNGTPDECDFIDGTPEQLAKVIAADAPAGEGFGESVALSGDTALIGAFFDPLAGPQSGSAYVFRDLDGNWQQVAKLTSPNPADLEWFGLSVSLSGDTALIGAPGSRSEHGSAFVFREVDGIWQLIVDLTPADHESRWYFGWSVSLSGDTAVVGRYGIVSHIFREVNGVWQEAATLTASDGLDTDGFGQSVSISGDTAVIGAADHTNGDTTGGAAYVFREVAGVWQQIAKLTPDDVSYPIAFGSSVSVSGRTVLVGANGDDINGRLSGSAYVFREIRGVWTQIAKLAPTDAAPFDLFGAFGHLNGGTAIIHCDGSLCIFREIEGTWVQTGKFRPANTLGTSVAFEGDTCIVGAEWDRVPGVYDGSAFIFDLNLGLADCNANNVPDECDLAIATSTDCNHNATPDECEPDFDADGLIDDCDDDIDDDGVPNELDACNYTPLNAPPGMIEPDGTLLGDLDGDCDVDAADHALFAPCMAGPNLPASAPCLASDLDGDSDADLADVAVSQQRLTGPSGP